MYGDDVIPALIYHFNLFNQRVVCTSSIRRAMSCVKIFYTVTLVIYETLWLLFLTTTLAYLLRKGTIDHYY